VEFNCRFGDPEAQVVLPLLETDLLDVALACTEGRLADLDIQWKTGAAACVVLASGGYPGKYETGISIHGLENEQADAFVFHAGTESGNGQVVTAGGRVLSVTGTGASIRDALQAAYGRIESIKFDKMHYRRDIGHQLSTDIERMNGSFTG
jgi:phosphoribosylamine--glycine ligase